MTAESNQSWNPDVETEALAAAAVTVAAGALLLRSAVQAVRGNTEEAKKTAKVGLAVGVAAGVVSFVAGGDIISTI